MTTKLTITTAITAAIACALLATGTTAAAGKTVKAGKKLYCWTENGHKVCGDALPPEAAESARTEISEKSGLQTGHVARALTGAERAAADTASQQAQIAADAQAARLRRDLAMVESYDSETALRDAYGERISLVETSLQTAALDESNLRRSLVALLGQAGNLELAGKPVPAPLLDNVRVQHAQLLNLLRIVDQQKRDRADLDDELNDAVARYRALKQPAGTVPATVQAPTQG